MPHSLNSQQPYNPVRLVTTIVPTLNEAYQIRECIQSLRQQPEISEIIIADGGSLDNTTDIAEALGVQVVACQKKGRGQQIREGIDRASGDVILVMHADCRLKDGAVAKLLSVLNGDPFIAGGAFSMAFTTVAPRFSVIAALNNLRARLFGISFGDQGQFVRMEALIRIGGFPEQMLMEDVELSLRLKKVGRITLLKDGIEVSARRWKKRNYVKHVAHVLYLVICYFMLRSVPGEDRRAKKYYRSYYR